MNLSRAFILRPVATTLLMLALLLSGVLSVIILGTGAFSLWRPEDRFFGRRLGGPAEADASPEGFS